MDELTALRALADTFERYEGHYWECDACPDGVFCRAGYGLYDRVRDSHRDVRAAQRRHGR